jgi:hypothetical protein
MGPTSERNLAAELYGPLLIKVINDITYMRKKSNLLLLFIYKPHPTSMVWLFDQFHFFLWPNLPIWLDS